MKTNFTIRLLGLFVCSLLLGTSLYAQTTVFYESCGNAGLTTGTRDTPEAYSDWDNVGSVTYSGTVDVRATGTINTHVWFAANNDKYFTISGINTSGYSDLRLSFELAANASGANSNNMSIKVKDLVSGAESDLTVPSIAIGSQNSYVSVENIPGIPATSNLEITFSLTAANNSIGYRLDDILITAGELEGSNNNLASLSVSTGVLNPAFSAQTTIYSVELPEGTTEVPLVMYTLEDVEATAVVTNATEIPGSTLITVKAANNSEKVYTINFVLETPAGVWLETFEGDEANKGSYGLAEFVGVATTWNAFAVITSTDDNDKKHGNRSVRLRDPNVAEDRVAPHYIEMAADKANGAGVISLYHAMYGSHTGGAWTIEVSDDGGLTWDAFSRTVTDVPSTLTQISFVVNVPGNIRVRIVKATEQVNSTSVNIDDISITDYVPTGMSVNPDDSSISAYAANGNLYILNIPEQANIHIYDITGKLVKTTQQDIVSLENSGIYIVKVISGGNTQTFKVINK